MGNEGSKRVIFGAGGHAKVVLGAARAAKLEVAYVYANSGTTAETFALKFGMRTLQDCQVDDETFVFHLAIGQNAVRRKIDLGGTPHRWYSVFHPSAIIAEDASLGDGVFVSAGAIIQPGVKIGRHVIINTGSIIEHDSIIGDYCHIAPGAVLSGEVSLGDGVLVGAGATVKKGCQVESWTDIGAGAAVVRSLSGFSTAMGVPARGHKIKP